ncbi:MAG: prefoldin subunit alpha [Candidatus Aenigmatarchaeota archaeon]
MSSVRIVNEETQKKVFEFQLLQAHLQELQQRQQMVAERMAELNRTKAAFEELKTVKAGDSALIPLGGENFVPGKIADTNNIFVGIGGGVAIKKSVDGAAEILDGRISEMEKVADELTTDIQATIAQLARLQSELEAMRE